MQTDQEFLQLALAQAQKSTLEGGIACGAVLVKNGEVVASGHDRTQQENDPIAIAEMDCMRKAGRRSDYAELTCYSTHSPCMLSAGTFIQFGVTKLVVSELIDTNVVQLLREKGVKVIDHSKNNHG